MVNIKLVFLLLLSLLPSVGYLLVYRKLKQQWEARLERVRWMAQFSYLSYGTNVTDSHLLGEELAVSYIGDLSCIYNARSPYIRCAVNPCGSCQDCPYYRSI
ncbi:MAG: DUF6464 family protein [Xenococcaceae cyanobacterium MO_167.B27]|nr:DUF6464 family protein [Xenococcaceae cyanobacterium MO_167.B27]